MGIYVLALVISAQDKQGRVGQPDVGWMVDERAAVGPSREDASELGLRWGGRALAVNGVEVEGDEFEERSAPANFVYV